MQGIIYAVLVAMAGSLVARLLIGGGLTFVTYVGIDTAIESLLGNAVDGFSALGDVALILYMAGVGEALSIVGGAVVASVTFHAARMFLARV